MKKTIIILSLILCTLFLIIGCSGESELLKTTDTAVETVTDIPIIEEVSIEKVKVRIKYPKLVNLESKSVEEKWNKIIENRITSDLELLTENDEYNLSYEVASNSNENLSIKLIGDCYYDGATQPMNFLYTYNISLSTGESVRLCDQTDVNNLAKNIYNNKGFVIESDVKDELMDYIYSAFENDESLSEMLINFDYNEDGELPYGYSFYEDGKLHLCIEVPHDLGDYAIIELENY